MTKKDKIKVKKATKKDVEKIAKIIIEEYAKYPYNEKWSMKNAKNYIKDYYKENSVVFVLEINGKVVGFIIGTVYSWYDGKKGFIDEVVISNKYQGKGYGKLIISYMESYFSKKRIKRATLMSNPKSNAFKFYKKLGYKKNNFVQLEKILK